MTTLAGLLIGLTIGLTGIGGGVLTAPVLLLFLGMPAPQAVGTALVYVAVVKIFAAPMFILRRQVNYRILALLLAGGVPGALAGSIFLNRLYKGGSEGLLLLLLGLTIVVSAAATFLRRPSSEIEQQDKSRRLPWVSFGIGLEVGFSSAGAGALGSLALMHWTKLSPAAIVGTDVLFGLALSAAAGSIHLGFGGVDAFVLRQLLLGGIPGAMGGAWLATVCPNRALRKGLAIWLMWLGANLCWRGVGALAR
ncbi:MAG: sulfite exporter TauE/SafE family protein [Bryobacteraceae bacterium]|nr:sulfite exporter TauE/SafE family protein [Bryobacteraceae bacterium]MDW8377289.1 sulfite exporter TauE/SafE family protein [Bryobacterales bacterium]